MTPTIFRIAIRSWRYDGGFGQRSSAELQDEHLHHFECSVCVARFAIATAISSYSDRAKNMGLPRPHTRLPSPGITPESHGTTIARRRAGPKKWWQLVLLASRLVFSRDATERIIVN